MRKNHRFSTLFGSLFRLMILFASVAVLVGCVDMVIGMLPEELRPKSKWMISEDAFRAKAKSVLVLEVYTDPEMMPLAPAGYEAFGFDKDFRDRYSALVDREKAVVNRIVMEALGKGPYRLKTASAAIDPALAASIVCETYALEKEGEVVWPNNKRYALTKETARKLAAAYQVDAVYFHYLQVNKEWHYHGWQEAYVDCSIELPQFSLQYNCILYDKNGANITQPADDYFTGVTLGPLLESHDARSDCSCRLVKKSFDDLKYVDTARGMNREKTRDPEEYLERSIKETIGVAGDNFIFHDFSWPRRK
jgi:hypothetical protein